MISLSVFILFMRIKKMKVLKQVYNLSHCILQPYDGIEDIPEQDVPVVLITKPNTETSVKKCGGKSISYQLFQHASSVNIYGCRFFID